ncbi:putative P4-family integrase [Nitrincola lacisaponensis]|uniref:Putative P4-family integrase n=2 Tax=Nitrincola lacisaponensis TaxID=267850 RepID=A0A063Y8C3_9GAMM|nr:putative P4-family integrase [Nitrincola lacisaponensis]
MQISPTGSKSWVLRTKVGERRRDFGLGGYPDVSLAQARDRAREYKDKILNGIDPVAERQANRSKLISDKAKSVTFEELAQGYIKKQSAEYKTAKQAQKLISHLETYVFPHIGKMAAADIQMPHIVAMLEPIWETKTETATRVRQHVEKILSIAIANKIRTDENPARWRGMLEHSTLPKATKVSKVQHLAALPVDDMPEFWTQLKASQGMGAMALQFIVLTACRSGEARGAKWEEIDLQRKIWTIPADRMKAGKVHEVPLTDEALALLAEVPRLSEYVFTNSRGGQLTDVAVQKAAKKIREGITPHGFRSTFKDWARKHTAYADEVSELQLAHVNNDSTRAAYARDGLIDKRRQLMTEWTRFCEQGHTVHKSATVTAIGGVR